MPHEGIYAVEVSPKGLANVNPPNKLLNVAKVNMAFNGLDAAITDRASILGVQNPYGKLDALARARQHRLTERNGNPLVELIKKREE